MDWTQGNRANHASVIRLIMIKLLFLAFLSFGLSHYAGGAQPLQAAAWTVIIAVIFAVLSLLLVKGRIIRLVSAVTFLAISYIGYYLGASESTTAFNSCVESSELIRQKVLDFRAQNNRFPENLHEVAILWTSGAAQVFILQGQVG